MRMRSTTWHAKLAQALRFQKTVFISDFATPHDSDCIIPPPPATSQSGHELRLCLPVSNRVRNADCGSGTSAAHAAAQASSPSPTLWTRRQQRRRLVPERRGVGPALQRHPRHRARRLSRGEPGGGDWQQGRLLNQSLFGGGGRHPRWRQRSSRVPSLAAAVRRLQAAHRGQVLLVRGGEEVALMLSEVRRVRCGT